MVEQRSETNRPNILDAIESKPEYAGIPRRRSFFDHQLPDLILNC
jgi:hypothetical protein